MKNASLSLIGLIIVVGAMYIFFERPAPQKFQKNDATSVENTEINTIRIGETSIKVDVADTAGERSLGLSGRESLEYGSGLLFVFPKPGVYSFWMKDMNFPIDIIWISEEMRVVGIEKSVESATFPETFSPPSEVLYVLEVPAGFSDRERIDIGDFVSLNDQI